MSQVVVCEKQPYDMTKVNITLKFSHSSCKVVSHPLQPGSTPITLPSNNTQNLYISDIAVYQTLFMGQGAYTASHKALHRN